MRGLPVGQSNLNRPRRISHPMYGREICGRASYLANFADHKQARMTTEIVKKPTTHRSRERNRRQGWRDFLQWEVGEVVGPGFVALGLVMGCVAFGTSGVRTKERRNRWRSPFTKLKLEKTTITPWSLIKSPRVNS